MEPQKIQPVVIDKHCAAKLERDLAAYPQGIIFPVDKPYKWTSSDVVRKIKYALRNYFGTKNIKIGHAGTLDPLATGLLIICVGKATKLSEPLQAEKKEYIAEFTLGATTLSFDREHPIDALYPTEHITPDSLHNAVAQLTAQTEQLPPVFSAKYVNGTRSYFLARHGEEVELKPAPIKIYSADLLQYIGLSSLINVNKGKSDNSKDSKNDDSVVCGVSACEGKIACEGKSACEGMGDVENYWGLVRPSYGADAEHNTFMVKKRIASQEDNPVPLYTENSLLTPEQINALPRAVVRIECSKGTYIRSVARDFGLALGSGAFMSALRRTASGGFRVEDAINLKEFFNF